MLKQATVFVLGAGVSHEVRMPLGSGLMKSIASILPHPNSRDDIVRHALIQDRGVEPAMRTSAAIRHALGVAPSIDALVEHRSDDPDFVTSAKIGITAAILRGETNSELAKAENQSDLMASNHQTIFGEIFRLIVGNKRVSALEDAFSRVAFVNFNYDRCLEHYLYWALPQYSGVAPSAAAKLISDLNIIHPYGWPGPLPWMVQKETHGPAVGFGHLSDHRELMGCAKGIRTFSEERGSTEDVEIQKIIGSAKQLIVLGCAFHAQNIRLLTPRDIPNLQAAYGTCYLPAPSDDLVKPRMEDFARPVIVSFTEAIVDWALSRKVTLRKAIQFEALTSRQLAAKYGSAWIE